MAYGKELELTLVPVSCFLRRFWHSKKQWYTDFPAPPVATISSPQIAHDFSEARDAVTQAISHASTMRQRALPRGASGAKVRFSTSAGARSCPAA
jgi:hypothetical protein